MPLQPDEQHLGMPFPPRQSASSSIRAMASWSSALTLRPVKAAPSTWMPPEGPLRQGIQQGSPVSHRGAGKPGGRIEPGTYPAFSYFWRIFF